MVIDPRSNTLFNTSGNKFSTATSADFKTWASQVEKDIYQSFAKIWDRDLTAPPGSPSDNVAYIVAATATGVWVGQENNIAHYINGTWQFYTPSEGDLSWLYDENQFIYYDGSAWVNHAIMDGSNIMSISGNSVQVATSNNQFSITCVDDGATHDGVTVVAASQTITTTDSPKVLLYGKDHSIWGGALFLTPVVTPYSGSYPVPNPSGATSNWTGAPPLVIESDVIIRGRTIFDSGHGLTPTDDNHAFTCRVPKASGHFLTNSLVSKNMGDYTTEDDTATTCVYEAGGGGANSNVWNEFWYLGASGEAGIKFRNMDVSGAATCKLYSSAAASGSEKIGLNNNGVTAELIKSGSNGVLCIDKVSFDNGTTEHDATTIPVLLSTINITSPTATADIESVLGSTYNNYQIVLEGFRPVTNNTVLYLRTSADNGANYDSGASDYSWNLQDYDSGSSGASRSGDGSDSEIHLAVESPANDARAICGKIDVLNVNGSTYKYVNWSLTYVDSNGDVTTSRGSGMRGNATNINAIRLLFSSGNVHAGKIKIYGYN